MCYANRWRQAVRIGVLTLQVFMLPPELFEVIIGHAWGCLSTSSHQHALSMTRWMLVSHDWLKIVLIVVFRDLWITSDAHFNYIFRICSFCASSFICGLAGITDPEGHFRRTCRCLTISVYHKFQGDYADECAQLTEYATADSPQARGRLFTKSHLHQHRYQKYAAYAISSKNIASFIASYTPAITSLHFVLIDRTAIYRAWDTSYPFSSYLWVLTDTYPASLVELHVTFAYTSPPPALLIDAPRGTFFPPPSRLDMPLECCFHGVRRLVVWDANADFVAFLTTACPQLQTIESTAEFTREDVPETVPAAVRDRLVFVCLPRTDDWGLTGSTDAVPLPQRDPPAERPASPALPPSKREKTVSGAFSSTFCGDASDTPLCFPASFST
ncbi:hypothetical protein MSAN_01150600 [Mycena sanguinolenta]|uniref:Uncharacterized protein n=1 Tax=Mycena sanguinolenta TaxID=230812 RepID=A0A8H6YLD4_9AGAR|nr:hypothetical protein MSAN_01150600 [Mycena sanguinolenta]